MSSVDKKSIMCRKYLRNNCHLGNGCPYSHIINLIKQKHLTLDSGVICLRIVTYLGECTSYEYMYSIDFINLYNKQDCMGIPIYDIYSKRMEDSRISGGNFSDVINFSNVINFSDVITLRGLYMENIRRFHLIKFLPLLPELCETIRDYKFIFRVEPITIRIKHR